MNVDGRFSAFSASDEIQNLYDLAWIGMGRAGRAESKGVAESGAGELGILRLLNAKLYIH